MTKREEMLEVYNHKNTGYIPNFFTDMDFIIPPSIDERPSGIEDGKDWFGVEWHYVPEALAHLPVPESAPITDITKWREQVTFPDLDAIDWEAAAAEETKDWDRENKISFMMLIQGPFERSHALMGFEEALLAMYEEPDDYMDLINALTDYKVKIIHIIGQYYKPDVLSFHDDYGANDSMLLSPDMWREFFKEPLQRIIDATHEEGMIYEHHSCGYIEPIFADLVEMGIDAIDPLQVTNPIRELKDKYQDRVTFVGGYDNLNVYDRPGVTEEEIRVETQRVAEELGPGGSFVAFPLTVTFDYVPIFIDEHFKHAFSYGDK